MYRFLMLIGFPVFIAIFVFSKYKPQESKKVLSALKEAAGVPATTLTSAPENRVAEPVDIANVKEEGLSKDHPYLKFEYQKEGKAAIVPADGEYSSIVTYEGQPIRITLGNSSEFEIIRMYGSDDSAFSSENLVFDWTAREVNTFGFQKEFFKYKFYKVAWKSVLSKSKKAEALFFLEGPVAQSPSLILTYQPIETGTKTAELSYVLEKDSQNQSASLPGLKLRKDSLLGLKIVSANQSVVNCVYTTPDAKKSDCKAWLSSDFIGNVHPQDLGWHTVDLLTDLGRFRYLFEILSIH